MPCHYLAGSIFANTLLDCEGTETPTDPQPPAITPNGTVVENCATGNKYTVKAGDTCNSIAREKSLVSVKL